MSSLIVTPISEGGLRVIRFILLKSIRGTDANILMEAIIRIRKPAAQNSPP